MRLLSSQGELVAGRCRATNRCDYCAIQTAHENARMLSLDAINGQAPELVAIVGTRTPTQDPAPFYRGRELVVRALRRKWPGAEYASQVEFTTGKGSRAGGLRRPHWNVLLKGIPADDVDAAREIVRRVWCQHVDAEPHAQYVEALQSTGAFMTYVALHFQKQSQAPPEGWSGQRFNASRSYFGEQSRAEARAAARDSLAIDRAAYRAGKLGLVDDAVGEYVERELQLRAETTWKLVDVTTALTAATSSARVTRGAATTTPNEAGPAELPKRSEAPVGPSGAGLRRSDPPSLGDPSAAPLKVPLSPEGVPPP